MNRRQFLKRTTSAIAGMLAFAPTLLGRTREMPAVVANGSPLPCDNFGLQGKAVVNGIAQGIERPIPGAFNGIKSFVTTGHSSGYEDSYPGFYHIGINDGGATRRSIERILADNPEMSRENAFLNAMLERAEENFDSS